jgi:cytidylate kinase
MAHKKHSIIIAVDGPAGSGKGTLAKRLGDHFDFPVLDTGLLYRAVGYMVQRNGESLQDENAALHAADALHDELLTGFLTNPELRSAASGDAASIVSAYPSVRQALFDLQRRFALNPPNNKKGAILDGRDIGTVICPDADVKIYLTASAEIRAERRAKELYGEHWKDQHATLLEQIKIRDARDSDRATAPLKPASDAVVLDTSAHTPDDVYQTAMRHINTKLGEKS